MFIIYQSIHKNPVLGNETRYWVEDTSSCKARMYYPDQIPLAIRDIEMEEIEEVQYLFEPSFYEMKEMKVLYFGEAAEVVKKLKKLWSRIKKDHKPVYIKINKGG